MDQDAALVPGPNQPCSTCETLDFQSLFQHTANYSQLRNDLLVLSWDLQTVEANHQCRFCCLLSRVLKLNRHTITSEDTIIQGYFEVFAVHRGLSGGLASIAEKYGRRLWIIGLKEDEDPFLFCHHSPNRKAKELAYTHCIQFNASGDPYRSSDDDLFYGRRVNTEQVDTVAFPVRYLALSYVWGGASQLQLTTTNFMILFTKNGLNELSESIPKTIQDAMILCQNIGERYLWVDTLCIIQDDDTDRHIQISNMDIIYSQAILTIVAASGSSADAGIPGVRPKSRSFEQHISSIDGKELISTRHDSIPFIVNSPWYSRGWTLQEYVLSHRLLFFIGGEAVYCCRTTMWREDTRLEDTIPEERHSQTVATELQERIRLLRPFSGPVDHHGFRHYTELVNAYITRNLSKDNDILDAISGALRSVYSSLGKFIYGHPEAKLGLSLLWQTEDKRLPERREGFPSWSWAGWKHRKPISTSWLDDPHIREDLYGSRKSTYTYRMIQFCMAIRLGEVVAINSWEDSPESDMILKDAPTRNELISIHVTVQPQLLLFWTTSACFPVARTCDVDSSVGSGRFGLYTILGTSDFASNITHAMPKETLQDEVLVGTNATHPEVGSIYLDKD
ncbi:HET-domain-containing protein [Lophium mytilinum]|uniref:HET-domain-containing protein n=1 Tax=Lophium mytilinum TaxID=390894 RepID=A0A6A6QL43_9PEZI|nr:HET-domain-containing protein [Lophium mytilinum]